MNREYHVTEQEIKTEIASAKRDIRKQNKGATIIFDGWNICAIPDGYCLQVVYRMNDQMQVFNIAL